jgi:hypothetical protein
MTSYSTVEGFIEHVLRVKNIYGKQPYRVQVIVLGSQVDLRARGYYAPYFIVDGVNYPTPAWVQTQQAFINHLSNAPWKTSET